MMQRRLTQHKRFVHYGTHPNFCIAKTSYSPIPLYEIPNPTFRKVYQCRDTTIWRIYKLKRQNIM